jgi:hypothetical protein
MAVNLQKEIGIVRGETVTGNVIATATGTVIAIVTAIGIGIVIVTATGKGTEIAIKTGTGTVIEPEIETGIVIATEIVTEIETGTEKGVGGVTVIEIVTRAGIGTGIVTVTGRERETGTVTGESLVISARKDSKFLVRGRIRCHLNSSKGRRQRNQVSWNGCVAWPMMDTLVSIGMTTGMVIELLQLSYKSERFMLQTKSYMIPPMAVSFIDVPEDVHN